MKKKAIEDANDQDSKKRVADETDKENKRPKIEDDDDALNDNIKFAASSTNSAAIATMKQDTSIRTEDALNDDSKVAASSISSTAIIATMKQDSSTRTAIAKIKQRFTIPKPGENGAVENTKLKDKRFVMTGTFPEVGGGAGLGLGKDKTKKMIESFGGKVTSAVSGKTDYLIIGMEPGASKVGKAKSKGVTMMDLRTIQQLLMGETDFENIDLAPPPAIESFSKGYQRGQALLE
jgi:NAD-dependent DNA ligase